MPSCSEMSGAQNLPRKSGTTCAVQAGGCSNTGGSFFQLRRSRELKAAMPRPVPNR
jgi:hypothetical protein